MTGDTVYRPDSQRGIDEGNVNGTRPGNTTKYVIIFEWWQPVYFIFYKVVEMAKIKCFIGKGRGGGATRKYNILGFEIIK